MTDQRDEHGVPDPYPRACIRPPWWETLKRIDAAKVKLLKDFQESLRLTKEKK